MKIQIDTDNKTIKILDNININELVKALESLLGKSYKEYTLENSLTYTYYPYNPYILTTPWTGSPTILDSFTISNNTE